MSSTPSQSQDGDALDKAMLAHAPKIAGSFWIFLAVVITASVVLICLGVALFFLCSRRRKARHLAKSARGDDLMTHHPTSLFFETVTASAEQRAPYKHVMGSEDTYASEREHKEGEYDQGYGLDYSYDESRYNNSAAAETAPLAPPQVLPAATSRKTSRARGHGGSRWQVLTDSSDDEEDEEQDGGAGGGGDLADVTLGTQSRRGSSAQHGVAPTSAPFGLHDYYLAQVAEAATPPSPRATRRESDARGSEAYEAVPLPPATPRRHSRTRSRRNSWEHEDATGEPSIRVIPRASSPPRNQPRRSSMPAEPPATLPISQSVGSAALPPSLVVGNGAPGQPRTLSGGTTPAVASPVGRPRSFSSGAASSTSRRWSNNVNANETTPPVPPIPAALRTSMLPEVRKGSTPPKEGEAASSSLERSLPVARNQSERDMPGEQEQPSPPSRTATQAHDLTLFSSRDSHASIPVSPPPQYVPRLELQPATEAPPPSTSASTSATRRLPSGKRSSAPSGPRSFANPAAAASSASAHGGGTRGVSPFDPRATERRGESWPSVPQGWTLAQQQQPQPEAQAEAQPEAQAEPARPAEQQGHELPSAPRRPVVQQAGKRHEHLHRRQSSQGAHNGGAWWEVEPASSTSRQHTGQPGKKISEGERPPRLPSLPFQPDSDVESGSASKAGSGSRLPPASSSGSGPAWYTWQGDWEGARRDSRGFGYV